MAKKQVKRKTAPFSLDTQGVLEGIAAHERMKPVANGIEGLDVAYNLSALRAVRNQIIEAEEAMTEKHAIKDDKGKPIPMLVSEEDLDFSRYDGAWTEREYAPGRIVTYAGRFYEAEDVTKEKPTESTWAEIGKESVRPYMADPRAFHKEIEALGSAEHEIELRTFPRAMLNRKGVTGEMVWRVELFEE